METLSVAISWKPWVLFYWKAASSNAKSLPWFNSFNIVWKLREKHPISSSFSCSLKRFGIGPSFSYSRTQTQHFLPVFLDMFLITGLLCLFCCFCFSLFWIDCFFLWILFLIGPLRYILNQWYLVYFFLFHSWHYLHANKLNENLNREILHIRYPLSCM